MATIELGGELLTLLPERAAYMPARRTLLVADAHIGKAVSFRRLGVPVPQGTTTETLGVLSALVARLDIRRIVFLGDLLHSRHAHAPATLAAFASWRTAHAGLDLTLVRGNHDDRAGDPAPQLDIVAVEEPLDIGGVSLCHHPRSRPGRYVLGGHLHPCVGVSGRAFDRLRLPCFWLGPHVGVLPAFGAFTGMHPIRRQASDRVFAVLGDGVAEVPSGLHGRANPVGKLPPSLAEPSPS